MCKNFYTTLDAKLNALGSLTAQHLYRHTRPSVCNTAVCVLEVCSALLAAEVAEPTAAQGGNAAEHRRNMSIF